MKFNPEDIDPLMLEIITTFNEMGFDTMACCQGRRNIQEFYDKKHCPAAYIAFVDSLPIEIQESAKSLNLNVYGDGECVSAVQVICPPQREGCIVGYREPDENNFCHEDWDTSAIGRMIEANEFFIDKIRKVFGIP
jgi:hypothetical protein